MVLESKIWAIVGEKVHVSISVKTSRSEVVKEWEIFFSFGAIILMGFRVGRFFISGYCSFMATIGKKENIGIGIGGGDAFRINQVLVDIFDIRLDRLKAKVFMYDFFWFNLLFSVSLDVLHIVFNFFIWRLKKWWYRI